MYYEDRRAHIACKYFSDINVRIKSISWFSRYEPLASPRAACTRGTHRGAVLPGTYALAIRGPCDRIFLTYFSNLLSSEQLHAEK